MVAEEVVRFERNLATANWLAPLLDSICESHRESAVEPFADATVTVTTPDNPYRPVQRFLSLVEESSTFREFDTTHMVPLSLDTFHERLFENTNTDLIFLPDTVERSVETYPDRANSALDRGHLKLRIREAVPYALALFDDRVGIGGYDEKTGVRRLRYGDRPSVGRTRLRRVSRPV